MRRETYSTPGAVRLNLEIPAGRIEVETSNTDETRVELEALGGNEFIRELVESARIELLRRGDGHEVVVEVKMRHGFWISFGRGPDLRLRVSCPHGAELDVRTKSADLQAHGEYSTVDVKTASGDVSIQQARADVRVKTASGDVHIRDAGDSITANTISGDQRLEAVFRGRMDLRAVSGDISVGVRRGSRVFVDANTVSGSTVSELV